MMAGTVDENGENDKVQEDKEDSDDDQEDDIKCEPCGEAPVVVAKSPGSPSHEDRERHNATHLPYRNWCPICVQARGREDDHRRAKEKDEGTVPTIVMDYKCFGQDEEDESLTSIVIRDKRTTCTAGHVCEKKGTDDRWIVDKVIEDIENWG